MLREEIRGLASAAAVLKRQACPECHVGDVRTHICWKSPVSCVARSHQRCGFRHDCCGGRERLAQPVVDIALVGEKMPGLAQRLWWLKRGLEMSERVRGLLDARARRASSNRARTNCPSTRPSPPSHGWKLRASRAGESLLRFACLVVERREFHGEIIARCDQIRMLQQLGKAPLRSDPRPLPKLVALIENARILPDRGMGSDRTHSTARPAS